MTRAIAKPTLAEQRRAAMDESDRFAEMVRPYWPEMYALARRMAGVGLADDVLQDSLVLAWRHRRTFDPERGRIRAWLLAIVANRARRVGRRAARLPDALGSVDGIDPSLAPDAAMDIRAAMTKLSGKQRLAVTLYYYMGLPVTEVALVMKCSEGTVKSTLYDARKHLHKILGDDYA